MARGAWARAMMPAIAAAGGDVDKDPFGLFASDRQPDMMPYDEAVYAATYGGG